MTKIIDLTPSPDESRVEAEKLRAAEKEECKRISKSNRKNNRKVRETQIKKAEALRSKWCAENGIKPSRAKYYPLSRFLREVKGNPRLNR